MQTFTMTTDTCGVRVQSNPARVGDVSLESVGDTLTGMFQIRLAHDTGSVRISFNAPVCTMDLDASAALGCISYPRCADAGSSTCVE